MMGRKFCSLPSHPTRSYEGRTMPEVSLPKIGRVVNLIGQTFSYLKVESYAGKIKTKTAWHCICVCGKGKIIRGNDLKKGNTKSCGCMHGPVHILHGHSRNGK